MYSCVREGAESPMLTWQARLRSCLGLLPLSHVLPLSSCLTFNSVTSDSVPFPHLCVNTHNERTHVHTYNTQHGDTDMPSFSVLQVSLSHIHTHVFMHTHKDKGCNIGLTHNSNLFNRINNIVIILLFLELYKSLDSRGKDFWSIKLQRFILYGSWKYNSVWLIFLM